LMMIDRLAIAAFMSDSLHLVLPEAVQVTLR
jgi:hypothetical protein